MTGIVPSLKNEGFDPVDIDSMSQALDGVCAALKIDDATAREVIAIRIIELATIGDAFAGALGDCIGVEWRVRSVRCDPRINSNVLRPP